MERRTYYVAEGGTGDGTPDNPWGTHVPFKNVAKPGDTLLIHGDSRIITPDECRITDMDDITIGTWGSNATPIIESLRTMSPARDNFIEVDPVDGTTPMPGSHLYYLDMTTLGSGPGKQTEAVFINSKGSWGCWMAYVRTSNQGAWNVFDPDEAPQVNGQWARADNIAVYDGDPREGANEVISAGTWNFWIYCDAGNPIDFYGEIYFNYNNGFFFKRGDRFTMSGIGMQYGVHLLGSFIQPSDPTVDWDRWIIENCTADHVRSIVSFAGKDCAPYLGACPDGTGPSYPVGPDENGCKDYMHDYGAGTSAWYTNMLIRGLRTDHTSRTALNVSGAHVGTLVKDSEFYDACEVSSDAAVYIGESYAPADRPIVVRDCKVIRSKFGRYWPFDGGAFYTDANTRNVHYLNNYIEGHHMAFFYNSGREGVKFNGNYGKDVDILCYIGDGRGYNKADTEIANNYFTEMGLDDHNFRNYNNYAGDPYNFKDYRRGQKVNYQNYGAITLRDSCSGDGVHYRIRNNRCIAKDYEGLQQAAFVIGDRPWDDGNPHYTIEGNQMQGFSEWCISWRQPVTRQYERVSEITNSKIVTDHTVRVELSEGCEIADANPTGKFAFVADPPLALVQAEFEQLDTKPVLEENFILRNGENAGDDLEGRIPDLTPNGTESWTMIQVNPLLLTDADRGGVAPTGNNGHYIIDDGLTYKRVRCSMIHYFPQPGEGNQDFITAIRCAPDNTVQVRVIARTYEDGTLRIAIVGRWYLNSDGSPSGTVNNFFSSYVIADQAKIKKAGEEITVCVEDGKDYIRAYFLGDPDNYISTHNSINGVFDNVLDKIGTAECGWGLTNAGIRNGSQEPHIEEYRNYSVFPYTPTSTQFRILTDRRMVADEQITLEYTR